MDYVIYLGLNDKDTKKQKISTLEAFKIASNILLNNNIDGATMFEAQGIYKHENGDIVIENTIRIELAFIDDESIIYNIIKLLKSTFNQESIMLKKVTEQISFI